MILFILNAFRSIFPPQLDENIDNIENAEEIESEATDDIDLNSLGKKQNPLKPVNLQKEDDWEL